MQSTRRKIKPKAMEGETLMAYFEDKIQDVKEISYAALSGKPVHWNGLKLEDEIDLSVLKRHPDATLACAFLSGMTFMLDLALATRGWKRQGQH